MQGIVVFLEAEGSARPKTSFFLKRRGPLVPKRRFLVNQQQPPALVSDQKRCRDPDFFFGTLF